MFVSVRALMAAVLAVLGALVPTPSSAQQRPLTTNDLMQPAMVKSVSMSPNGRYVAYLERTTEYTALARAQRATINPEGHDYLHRIRLLDLSAPETQAAATLDVGTDIPVVVHWGGPNRLLVGTVAISEDNGHERPRSRRVAYYPFYWRILSIDVETGARQVMFGDSGAWSMRERDQIAELVDPLSDDPDHVLIAASYRDRNFDLWRVSLETGQARQVEHGRNSTVSWRTNENGEAVFRLDFDADRDRVQMFRRRDGEERWQREDRMTLDEFSEEVDRARRSIWVADTDDEDMVLVLVRPDHADRRGVYRYNIETDELGDLYWEHDLFDVNSVIRNAYSQRVIAMTYFDDRRRIHFLNRRHNSHYRGVASFFGDDAVVEPVQVFDDAMLLYVSGPQEPGSFYAYRMSDTSIRPVAVENPVLLQTRLSPVSIEHYTARDGERIQAFLTRPVGHAASRLPMIILPHGGPEMRDSLGFDFVAQYFASEGWAVFQPNFRGSGGMGRAFAEAGHRQWSGLMQNDVTDGVHWLINEGIADPRRICIAGFSYGGYAALAGAIMTPNLYRCAVSVAGVTDLPAFLESERVNDPEGFEYWRTHMGDPETDRAYLESVSPTYQARSVRIPVLLIHGTEDKVVPVQQTHLMRDALESVGADYRYWILDGADHDFDAPLPLSRTLALMEAFLGESLDLGPPPEDRSSWQDLTERSTFSLARTPRTIGLVYGGAAQSEGDASNSSPDN